MMDTIKYTLPEKPTNFIEAAMFILVYEEGIEINDAIDLTILYGLSLRDLRPLEYFFVNKIAPSPEVLEIIGYMMCDNPKLLNDSKPIISIRDKQGGSRDFELEIFNHGIKNTFEDLRSNHGFNYNEAINEIQRMMADTGYYIDVSKLQKSLKMAKSNISNKSTEKD